MADSAGNMRERFQRVQGWSFPQQSKPPSHAPLGLFDQLIGWIGGGGGGAMVWLPGTLYLYSYSTCSEMRSCVTSVDIPKRLAHGHPPVLHDYYF